MGSSAWSNPGPAKQVVIAGPSGELLVYSGPPAAGNLLLAVSAAAGTDPYGNQFGSGLSVEGNDGNVGLISLMLNNGTLQGKIFEAGGSMWLTDGTSGPVQSGIEIGDLTGAGPLITNPIALSSAGIAIAQGPVGKSYSRDMTWSQNLTGGTFTQITAFTTVKQHSGYGTPFAAGVFTAPVDSYYDASLSIDTVAGATALVTVIRRNGVNINSNNSPNVGRGLGCSVNAMWLNANDTVTWHVSETGVAGPVACTGNASISRRVG